MNTTNINELVSSIEKAETIVRRMESVVDNTEDHKELSSVLSMHRFIMKVYAVVLVVLILGLVIGTAVVSHLAANEKIHEEQDAAKYEKLMFSVNYSQETNKQLIIHLLALQEASMKNDKK